VLAPPVQDAVLAAAIVAAAIGLRVELVDLGIKRLDA
jgi:hypothetical protein